MNPSIFVTLLGLGLLFCACSGELDLQPSQSIGEEVALNSDATVKAVLVGAYDRLGDGDLYGGNLFRDADLLGGTGEILFVGTFNSPDEIARKQITAGNADAEARWLEGYEAINIANNVLSALEVVDADDQARIEGEARFIRGLVYFDLVRYYGLPYATGGSNGQLGIPIVTTPTRGISAESEVSRASVEEVYAQVLTDLTTAADLLPETNGTFASSNAATALLARVYLQMGRYAEARDAASAVIESDYYMLTPTYASAFMNGSNSTEDIFAIQVTSQDGVNNLTTFFSTPQFGGRDGDIEILPAHLALYEEADQRLALFYTNADGSSTYTGKFNNQFANISVIRLAEMYLIRAEANERLGTDIGATPLEDINTLRSRSGLDDLDDVDLTYILNERRRELAFEGVRIHDIKRLQGSVGNIYPYNAPQLVFPIPSRETVANPNLIQNEGYNN